MRRPGSSDSMRRPWRAGRSPWSCRRRHEHPHRYGALTARFGGRSLIRGRITRGGTSMRVHEARVIRDLSPRSRGNRYPDISDLFSCVIRKTLARHASRTDVSDLDQLQSIDVATLCADPFDGMGYLVEDLIADQQCEPCHFRQCSKKQARVAPCQQIGVDRPSGSVELVHRCAWLPRCGRVAALARALSSMSQSYSSRIVAGHPPVCSSTRAVIGVGRPTRLTMGAGPSALAACGSCLFIGLGAVSASSPAGGVQFAHHWDGVSDAGWCFDMLQSVSTQSFCRKKGRIECTQGVRLGSTRPLWVSRA